MNIITPVGRLIQGDCFKGQDKDRSGAPLLVKSGPNVGQPRTNYFLGLAIAKTDPGVEQLLTKIREVARQGHPTLFDAANNCTNPKFAFKYVDGDSQELNENGKRWCDLANHPGNYVFKFSSGYAPKCYTENCVAPITDHNQLKRGYYIRISGSIGINADRLKPGVYLNHNMIEMIGYGPEIQSSPDPKKVFGAVPVSHRPAGMSVTPLPQKDVIAEQILPLVQQVKPATDFLNPPQKPPAEPNYKHPDGQVHTRTALIVAGWSDAQISGLEQV